MNNVTDEAKWGKKLLGRTSDFGGGVPEPKEGYSVWVENGEVFTAPTVDASKFGGHAYDDGGYGNGIRDCHCGAMRLSGSSDGPVDPFGPCPMNPKTKATASVTDEDRAKASRITGSIDYRKLPYEYNATRNQVQSEIAQALATTRTTAYAKGRREAVEGIRKKIEALQRHDLSLSIDGELFMDNASNGDYLELDEALSAIDSFNEKGGE